jgi:hypothetical protein
MSEEIDQIDSPEDVERKALEDWRAKFSADVGRTLSLFGKLAQALGELQLEAQAGMDRFGGEASGAISDMAIKLNRPLTVLHNEGWREPQTSVPGKHVGIHGMLPPGRPLRSRDMRTS